MTSYYPFDPMPFVWFGFVIYVVASGFYFTARFIDAIFDRREEN